jgi:hypothetical protein
MIKAELVLSALFLFVFFIPFSRAQLTVGVSPPALYVGEIEPGTYKIVNFNLITSSEDVFLVSLVSVKGNINIFNHDEYKDFILNYSEEDVSSWVEFNSNPVELKRADEKLTTKAGSTITGAKEITFIIHVPKNAEPGYHTGKINFDPRAPPGYGGMFTIETVVPFTYIFKVPGLAVRGGKIFDVVSSDCSGKNLVLEIFFRNTGTVTFFPNAGKVEIFDRRNRTIDTLYTPTNYIKPGEMKRFKIAWNVEDLALGSYDASARVDYVTGSASKKSTIEVFECPSAPPTAKVIERAYAFPWWILVIIVIIIATIYLFLKRQRYE